MTAIKGSSIVLITGTDLRHQYFVRQIHARFPVKAVLTEEIQYPAIHENLSPYKEAWNSFFKERNIHEKELFTSSEIKGSHPPPVPHKISNGELNSADTLSYIKSLNPGFIALFDSNLVGERMMEQFQDRIFNLHLGITEKYRGSSCNFWPIFDGHPEHLGATILKVNRGIDTGDVAAQRHIQLEPTDDVQVLMGKVVLTGVELMLETLDSWRRGTLKTIPLSKKGTLFLRNQFTPEAVYQVQKMAENGEISNRIAGILQQKQK